MEDLTFGEQVKIILSRKKMTIKQLAELIELQTGQKMSRQNLTQRLGRDNFQEQDMRMIAAILGCPFTLNIITGDEAPAELPIEIKKVRTPKNISPEVVELQTEPVNEVAEAEPEVEMVEEPADESLAEMETEQAAVEEAVEEIEEIEEAERDMTIGEIYEIHEELDQLEEAAEMSAGPEEALATEPADEPEDDPVEEKRTSQTAFSPTTSPVGGHRTERRVRTPKDEDFEPVIKHEDLEEDRVNGDVNPYTGREYMTNSVRVHPKRIGYVQVYDRSDHKWTDMTEWAFLGYQERKKALLGKEYEPPIYLD